MEKMAAIFRRYNVILAYLFGSQKEHGWRILLGERVTVSDPLTDIDVGVIFRDFHRLPAAKNRLFAGLYNELDEFFFTFKVGSGVPARDPFCFSGGGHKRNLYIHGKSCCEGCL